MDSVIGFMKKLKKENFEITINDGKLEVKSPQGVKLSETDRQLITDNKDFILKLIENKTTNHLKVIDRCADIPLASNQERLWFLDKFESSATSTYNIPVIFQLKGTLRTDLFEKSIDLLIERHEILRTRFREKDGAAYQEILQAGEWSVFSMEELGNESIQERLRKIVHLSFDLSQGPLFKIVLIKYEKNKQILIILLHHIISDAWSLGIFFDELSKIYNALVIKKEIDLVRLPFQYADYAHWQRQRLKEGMLKLQTNYWLKKLSNYQTLEMPTDFQRPPMVSYKGNRTSFAIPTDLFSSLKELAIKQKSTLFNLLLAALNIVISRYSQQKDILIGSPIANRVKHFLEPVMGFFSNTVVFRNYVDGLSTFDSYLQNVTKNSVEAFENQEVPFEQLIDLLNVDRDPSRAPLFQIMIVLQQSTKEKRLQLFDLETTEIEFDFNVSKFDLTFFWETFGQNLSLTIEYCEDLFQKETVEGIGLTYIELLKSIVANAYKKIKELNSLTKKDQAKIRLWNQTAKILVNDDKCLHELFNHQAAKAPQNLCVVSARGNLNYSQVFGLSNRIGHKLIRMGVLPGELVAVAMEKGWEQVVSVLGILKSGAAYLPVSLKEPAIRFQKILNQGAVKIVLTQKKYLHKARWNQDLAVLAVDDDKAWQNEKPSSPEVSVNNCNLAYNIFTSGSSGEPKGVMIDHRGAVNTILDINERFGITEKDAILALSPLNFDLSVYDFFGMLATGGKIVLPAKEDYKDPESWCKLIKAEKVTLWNTVPALMQMLLEYVSGSDSLYRYNVRQIKTVLLSGDWIPLRLPLQISEHLGSNTRLVSLGGATEASIWSIIYPIGKFNPAWRSIPYGKPMWNQKFFVLDEYLEPVPIGVKGELFIGGRGLAKGYWKNEKQTNESFLIHPKTKDSIYKTGDTGRYNNEGIIEFMGRKDHQIKIRGFRIEIGEIESVLKEINGIKSLVVMALGEGNGKFLAAIYVAENDCISVDNIKIYLKERLPEYMVPTKFLRMDTIPLTQNGKIDRNALSKLEIKEEEYIAPTTETEYVLSRIWARILKKEKIGIQDHFFKTGGNSLSSVQLTTRVNKQFCCDLSIKEIFVYPILAELATRIDQIREKDVNTRCQGISRSKRLSPIPLSFAQQRLWFIENYENNDESIYNVPIILNLKGDLDLDTLSFAINQVTKRHEILRTCFPDQEGAAYQSITDDEVIDLIYSEPAELSLKQFIEREIHFKFDIRIFPLIRFSVLKKNENNYLFIINAHHIITDGWSNNILLREIFDFYRAKKEGKKIYFDELKIQYADYAIWQQKLFLNEEGENRLLSFWKGYLENIEELRLPYDKPRPINKTYNGDNLSFRIDNLVTQKCKKLSYSIESTFYTVLIAGFSILLSRYCGQKDIIIGSPIANRTQEQMESLIGLFVNSLVIRNRVEPNQTLQNYLLNVKDSVINAFSHQDISFEKLVNSLEVDRDPGKSPVFQVMLAHQNIVEELVLDVPELEISFQEVRNTYAKFDLTLFVEETSSGLECSLEYNTDLFHEETIKRMSKHFMLLLEQLASFDPKMRIKDLNMIDEKEKYDLLYRYNNQTTSYDTTKYVHELFEIQSQKNPHAVAVEFRNQSITYGELDDRSNQLANYLVSQGIGPEKCVGILVRRSIEAMVAFLAVMKSNGTFIPFDPDYPSQRINFMLRDSEANIVLTQTGLKQKLNNSLIKSVCLDDELPEIDAQSKKAPTRTIQPKDLAYIIYTSGSTGKPKGVMIEHRGFSHYMQWATDYYKCDEGSGSPVYSSLAFDLTMTPLFGPLVKGKTVFMIADELGVSGLLEALKIRQDYSLIKITPAHLKLLQHELNIEILRKLEAVIVIGGEALYKDDLQFWHQHSPNMRFINEYGATETSVACTIYEIGNSFPNTPVIPVGKAIPMSQMYILGEFLEVLPVGVAGEIYLSGNQLSRGYLKRETTTKEKFLPHPYLGNTIIYKTGDIGKLLTDGNVEYLGRKDDQVKIKGYRVELGEIESALKEHVEIQDCVVVVKGERNQRKLIAYYIPKKAPQAKADLEEFLKRAVPGYMVPSAFVNLESFPLTINGKIDKANLPNPEIDDFLETYVAPRTDKEKRLAIIWKHLLNLNQVGVHDNFFSLGGDSVLSIQVVSRARSSNLYITPKDIFTTPTIEALAKKASATGSVGIEQNAEFGEVLLTPIQQWFFEENFVNKNYFNQSCLLTYAGELDVKTLEVCVNALIHRHDSLRLRFSCTSDEYQQRYHRHAQDTYIKLKQEDISIISAKEHKTEITNICSKWQASLAIDTGPILCAGVIKGHYDRHDRLLLTIHHLVVDGVSWRIIVNDLKNAYESAILGRSIKLPPKTHSYKVWSRALAKYANSNKVKASADYWLEVGRSAGLLPVDHKLPYNHAKRLSHIDKDLSTTLTNDFIKKCNGAYNTQVNDLLLSALALTMKNFANQDEIYLHLEGHGREHIDESIDVSETVGWFTNLYPICLKITEDQSLNHVIPSIKEQLRCIPHNGLSYGALRYLSRNEVIRKKLRSRDQAQITFNYLGQMDLRSQNEKAWQMAAESFGESVDQRNHYPDLLSFNSVVEDGCLNVRLSYSDEHFESASMQKLLGLYVSYLEEIVVHCIQSKTAHHTPSDFPKLALTQSQIEEISRSCQGGLEAIYNLTSLQEGLLFHKLCNTESDQYVVQIRKRYEGQLDIDSFKKAWQTLVNRHSILRTKFRWNGVEKPIQIVEQQTQLSIVEEDWRELGDNAQTKAWENLYQSDLEKGFDLENSCLMRVYLIQISKNMHKLIWTHHHIILDGWSLSILMSELDAYYEIYSKGQSLNINPGSKYKHYVDWIGQQDNTIAKEFWQKEIADFSEPTDIGIKIPGVQIDINNSSGNQTNSMYEFDESLTDQITHFAKKQKVTLNSFVQLAWSKVLSIYSGQDSVLYGMTVSGRSHEIAGIEEMVGLFINSVPVKVKFKQKKSVTETLVGLHKKIQQVNDFGYFPLREIQRITNLKPDQTFFETLFIFENYPIDSAPHVKNGLRIFDEGAQSKTNYPLVIYALPGKRFRFMISFDKGVFNDSMINRLAEHLKRALSWMIVNPQKSINEIEILTLQEENLLEKWNDTDTQYPTDKTFDSLFGQQVNKTPNAVAACCEDRCLRYSQLNEQARKVGTFLSNLGVKPNQLVAIYQDRDLELLVSIIGIFKVGGAYLPLDIKHSASRICHLLRQSESKILITTQCYYQQILSILAGEKIHDIEVTVIEEILESEKPYGRSEISVTQTSPEDLAYVMYTSGSTGLPKGAMLKQKGMINHLFTRLDSLNLAGMDVIAQTATQCFDISVWQFLALLLVGGKIEIFKDNVIQNPTMFLEQVEQRGVTVLEAVPSLLQIIAEEAAGQPSIGLRSVRWAISVGEPLPVALCKMWMSKFPSIMVVNAYAPTECSDGVACNIIKKTPPEEITNIPIGSPIGNMRVYILNKNLRKLPIGIRGEIYVSGIGVGLGYFNDEQRTRQTFVKNPHATKNKIVNGDHTILYKTGDIGRWLPNGKIEHLGRNDFQVKIRGFRVELGEIEATLLRLQSVSKCVVMAFNDDQQNVHQLVAYYVSSKPFTSKGLKNHLSKSLPDYMIPRLFINLTEMPLTSNGKIDRKSLPKPECEKIHETEYMAPTSDIERKVETLWQEIFKQKRISVADNFFGIGGDSLKAIRLVGKFKSVFGFSPAITWIFQHPTIRRQAKQIFLRERQITYNPIVQYNTGKYRVPLIFAHPFTAGAEVYADVCRFLTVDVPFYALESYNIHSNQAYVESMEDLAQEYIKQLTAALPKGPYCLGGWSLGGVIAFEMAKQLQEKGYQIFGLYLIDAVLFNPLPEDKLLTIDGISRRIITKQLSQLKKNMQWYIKRVKELTAIESRMLRNYVPHQYDGRTVLFNATQIDTCPIKLTEEEIQVYEKHISKELVKETNGWGPFVKNIREIRMPISHHAIMESQHLEWVVEQICQDMRKHDLS